MFDMTSSINKFYRDNVVLSASAQNSLRTKKKLNIKRLKEGLREYNEIHNTEYSICENRVQGSMAMHTVVQNDGNEYDIDIAIVFEESKLNGLGPLAVRNMVAEALKLKTNTFSKEPEVKTSCVRLQYSEGYHIDFAIYRRYKESYNDTCYRYQHAGSRWEDRDVKALEEWFDEEIMKKGKDLRIITRLSKMFCKSDNTWINMPSGLVQTILCDEQIVSYNRIDEMFYHTMQRIVARLELNLYVEAPVDGGRTLVTREIDKIKIKNYQNRLKNKLKELDILFSNDCTYEKAAKAWGRFFNHPYWSELLNKEGNSRFSMFKATSYSSTEEFIEDKFFVEELYNVEIECNVVGNGIRLMPICDFLNRFNMYIPQNFKVECKIAYTNAPSYDKIFWKVRNVGSEAKRRNNIRGQILDRGEKITENTMFAGDHYIECFLIKDNRCIAIGYIDVPIGKS